MQGERGRVRAKDTTLTSVLSLQSEGEEVV